MSDIKKGVMMLSFFFRPSVGGLETHLDDLCAYLSDSGHKVFVVTFQPLTNGLSGKFIERKGNLTVYRIPTPLHNMFYRFESKTMLRYIILTPFLLAAAILTLALHRKEIDVIHCHDLNSALLCAFVSWLFGKRSVLTVHFVQDFLDSSSSSAFNSMGRRVMDSFDAVIAVSSSVAQRLIPLVHDRSKVRIMTNWIDLSFFKPRDFTGSTSPVVGAELNVLFVGRMVSTKGVELAVDAARLLSHGDEARFVFVGQGPLSGMVQEASKELDNVEYVGLASEEMLRTLYAKSDILLVPSTYEEGFGRVIMEALACGTPVVGSKRGGIPEALDTGVGILIEPTSDEIVRVIRELTRDKARLSSLKMNCRAYAEQRFGVGNASAVTSAYGW